MMVLWGTPTSNRVLLSDVRCRLSQIVFFAKMNLLRAIARYVVVGWRHFDRFHLSRPKKAEERSLQGLHD